MSTVSYRLAHLLMENIYMVTTIYTHRVFLSIFGYVVGWLKILLYICHLIYKYTLFLNIRSYLNKVTK